MLGAISRTSGGRRNIAEPLPTPETQRNSVEPRGQRDLPNLPRSTEVFKTARNDRRNGMLANVSDRRL